MNKLKEIFYKMGFEIDFIIDETHTYMKHPKILGIEIVSPHNGNDFKWLIRAEFYEVFNKWGSSPYWAYIKDFSDENINDLVFDIELLIKNKDLYLSDSDDFENLKFRLTNY